jgi:hypothetical protein
MPEAAPAGHADLRGAVDDSRDAGGRAFGGDVEGGVGMPSFEGLRELRDELGAKDIGAFDDKAVGLSLRSDETQGRRKNK